MGYYIHTVIVFVIGNTIRKAVVTVMIGNYIHRVIVLSREYGISSQYTYYIYYIYSVYTYSYYIYSVYTITIGCTCVKKRRYKSQLCHCYLLRFLSPACMQYL